MFCEYTKRVSRGREILRVTTSKIFVTDSWQGHHIYNFNNFLSTTSSTTEFFLLLFLLLFLEEPQ